MAETLDSVAVSLNLAELRKARDMASKDFDHIKTFSYAVADILSVPRGSSPFTTDKDGMWMVYDYLNDLYKRAERLAAAQREPFHL